MEQFLVLLIPLCILWTWLSPIGLTNRTIEGTVIQITPITLLARIKRHAVTNFVTLVVTLSLVLADMASPLWLVAAVISAVGILSFPQVYTVTTRGIRVGRGNFHRWTEFAGVYRSRAGASLQSIRRRPDLPIWLSGSRDDDEFVHLLRTLVRDSYKGKTTPIPQTSIHESTRRDGPTLPGIAAFKRGR
jgi:hypothetical protein